eukprot:c7539_g1_i1.p1 GENE.c7539_g1_i1~~c7539_g1_i1.p1  ORF type:complete len:207 (-),score=39.24 c7539_g1_i1:588-1208(-)
MLRRPHRRAPKSKFPYSEDDLFTDCDFASSPDDGFSSLANITYEDDDSQIRNADHLFEVLLDMFPRSPPEDLQEVWEKHRPNLEAAICHVLAQSEQQYPDTTDENNNSQMQDATIWFSEWPDLNQNNDDFRQSQTIQRCESSYRDCLMREPDDYRWDGLERDTNNDNTSEASFGSVLSGVSSSVQSSTSHSSFASGAVTRSSETFL